MSPLLLLAYGASISLSLLLVVIPISFIYDRVSNTRTMRKIIEANLGDTEKVNEMIPTLQKGSKNNE